MAHCLEMYLSILLFHDSLFLLTYRLAAIQRSEVAYEELTIDHFTIVVILIGIFLVAAGAVFGGELWLGWSPRGLPPPPPPPAIVAKSLKQRNLKPTPTAALEM